MVSNGDQGGSPHVVIFDVNELFWYELIATVLPPYSYNFVGVVL